MKNTFSELNEEVTNKPIILTVIRGVDPGGLGAAAPPPNENIGGGGKHIDSPPPPQ